MKYVHLNNFRQNPKFCIHSSIRSKVTTPCKCKKRAQMFAYVCKQKNKYLKYLENDKNYKYEIWQTFFTCWGYIIWNFQVDTIFSYPEIVNIYFLVNKHKQRFCAHFFKSLLRYWKLIISAHFGHAWAYLATPTQNMTINLQLS